MSKLKIVPLGGLGNVTQNMFLYEYENEILIVDCGIGFPDSYMPGVDVLIPDIEYLLQELEAGKHVVGMVLSHGHDDHIAATPYIMPVLPQFPIYASALTAGFAEQRMRDGEDPRTVMVAGDNDTIKLGQHFSFRLLPVTHSVPDTRHIVITTPEGIIYHGSDFKLDPSPVDGVLTDIEHISQLKEENVLCMLIDCLRVEYRDWVESEAKAGPAILQAMQETEGKIVMTLMSSHIHRIQQTIDACEKLGRKVVFIGRSVEQNVEIALRLGKLKMPEGMKVDKRHMEEVDDKKLCVIVAGAQGQEGSSLMRAVYGEHRILRINARDTVIFSADAIPGNEQAYFGAIDELCRNKVHVLYPDVMPDLHKSGHASAPEQQELLGLVRPKYVMPVGGQDRHRYKFFELVASQLGYDEEHVLIPDSGEIIGFENRTVSNEGSLNLRPQIVDGLGIGDVGPMVLSDRRTLGQAGIVMVLVPKSKGEYDLRNVKIVSRGFVFMKEADEVVQFIKTEVAALVTEELRKKTPDSQLKAMLEKRLSRKLYKVIRREPMIVAEIFEV
ncbi:MAG: ribonuclease J [Patescibacteria group bacterium]|nr:MAG: ribonuclease J [Patescibacteria group bacterium]